MDPRRRLAIIRLHPPMQRVSFDNFTKNNLALNEKRLIGE
jgi:hypothetical protein